MVFVAFFKYSIVMPTGSQRLFTATDTSVIILPASSAILHIATVWTVLVSL